jgi:predicted lysophospholipase L1 biosynthesis ABC-type transport system permease subunit
VINESMAKYYFPNADPIGRTITAESTHVTIVGVVRDIAESDVRAAPGRWMYVPIAQDDSAPARFYLTVRVAGDASRFVAPLRNALHSGSRNLKFEVTPLRERVRDSVAQDLLVSRVTTFFGILALILAGVGLYGVTSHTALQRTGELGLRAALGAQPRDVAALILREAVSLAVAGLAVGVPAGMMLARLIRTQLFVIKPIDPPSLIVTVFVLVATALVASYLPARRAARIDPIEALRAE